MGVPVPKPTRSSPETRRAERQSRDYNPLKPPPKEKKPPKALGTAKPLGRNSTIGIGKGTLKRSKPALARQKKRQPQTFWVTSGKRQLVKKQRKPLRLLSLSESARERRRQDRIWAEKVRAIWGTCIITGEDGRGFWPVDPHHCWDKSIRPQWRHEPWNGLLLRRDVHDKADEWPEFHEACQAVADECRAAEEGRRPMPTRTEVRQILFDRCPRIRQYARPEADE